MRAKEVLAQRGSWFTDVSPSFTSPLQIRGQTHNVSPGAAPAAALAETQCVLTFPFSPTYVLHSHPFFTAQEQEMPGETRQLHYNRGVAASSQDEKGRCI